MRLAAAFEGAAPLTALEGFVTDQESGRRASRVQVYAVDERFWRFHGVDVEALDSGDALLSEGLARELATSAGQSVVLRVEKRLGDSRRVAARPEGRRRALAAAQHSRSSSAPAARRIFAQPSTGDDSRDLRAARTNATAARAAESRECAADSPDADVASTERRLREIGDLRGSRPDGARARRTGGHCGGKPQHDPERGARRGQRQSGRAAWDGSRSDTDVSGQHHPSRRSRDSVLGHDGDRSGGSRA